MMEEGDNPWKILTEEGEKSAPPSSFLLHRDFKPANISLSDSTGQADGSGDFTATYPKLKVGDFGLAELTDPTSARNPKDLFGRGTRFFKPPEQMLVGVEWDKPPNGQRNANLNAGRDYDACYDFVRQTEDGHGIKFTAKHNIWAVGKTMLDLAFLANPFLFHNNRRSQLRGRNSEQQEELYYVDERWFSHFHTAKNHDYDHSLIDLINDCLWVEASKRPSALLLRRRAEEGLERCKAKFPDPQDPRLRLFFRGNEINDMEFGNAYDKFKSGFRPRSEWDALMRHEYHDLRWGPLRPPYERWKKHIDRAAADARAHGTWPIGQGPFQWVDGGIVFTPDIPAAPVPPVAPEQPMGPAPAYPAPGRRACTHRCRDKTTCGHAVCCKIGLKK